MPLRGAETSTHCSPFVTRPSDRPESEEPRSSSTIRVRGRRFSTLLPPAHARGRCRAPRPDHQTCGTLALVGDPQTAKSGCSESLCSAARTRSLAGIAGRRRGLRGRTPVRERARSESTAVVGAIVGVRIPPACAAFSSARKSRSSPSSPWGRASFRTGSDRNGPDTSTRRNHWTGSLRRSGSLRAACHGSVVGLPRFGDQERDGYGEAPGLRVAKAAA